MKTISRSVLEKFLIKAGDRVSGDWVIIGGSVLQMITSNARVTVDIDLAGPDSATQVETVALMDIAQELKLPVESINQAGAFFLRGAPNWHDNLVLIHSGKTAKFYRPNAYLYILLKSGRMTETDLADSLAMLAYAKKHNEPFIAKKLLTVLAKKLKKAEGDRRSARLHELMVRIRDENF